MRIRCKIGIIACLNQLVISIRLQSYANYFNLQSRVDNYFSFIASFFVFFCVSQFVETKLYSLLYI